MLGVNSRLKDLGSSCLRRPDGEARCLEVGRGEVPHEGKSGGIATKAVITGIGEESQVGVSGNKEANGL